MSQEENLLALGAVCFAGDLLLKNKSMGTTRNGLFAISQDGLAALSVVDVSFKEVKTPKARAKTATAAPTISELDSLLDD